MGRGFVSHRGHGERWSHACGSFFVGGGGGRRFFRGFRGGGGELGEVWNVRIEHVLRLVRERPRIIAVRHQNGQRLHGNDPRGSTSTPLRVCSSSSMYCGSSRFSAFERTLILRIMEFQNSCWRSNNKERFCRMLMACRIWRRLR